MGKAMTVRDVDDDGLFGFRRLLQVSRSRCPSRRCPNHSAFTSNAITLERLTSQHPNAGPLLTFFQFLAISLYGLPGHLVWTPYGPRFKPRTIPLTPYLTQVALFYIISLLNNAAFAYHIPMTVHIIFRSGGLIISMLLGRIVVGKRYPLPQIISVFVVTAGVVLATLSVSRPARNPAVDVTSPPSRGYASGIAILTLALLLSGFLGLVQDHTYSKYGRPKDPTPSSKSGGSVTEERPERPAWQESMFYLHFLALPFFFVLRSDLWDQLAAINSDRSMSVTLPIPPALCETPKCTYMLPAAYLPLLFNTITQIVCVAGVHRLTTRVSALTVTLVLVVRKAVSLMFSAFGFGSARKGQAERVDALMMWSGASMVLIGTIAYSMSTKCPESKKED